MPITAGPALRKVTLNLFAADVAILQHRYGYGYSEQIRRIVNDFVKRDASARKTVADILKEDN